jgi:hypothetical protein
MADLKANAYQYTDDKVQELRNDYEETKGRVDTFLDSTEVEGVVDTLHEIQQWMEGSGADVTDLTKEIARVDAAWQTSMASEKATRESEDAKLQTAIDTEKAAREAADEALQTAIDAEAAAREAADANLQTMIEGEAAQREGEMADLKANAYQYTDDKVKAEADARVAEDAKLQDAIDALNGSTLTLGADVKDGDEVKYEASTPISSVLQGIQNSVSNAVSTTLTGVVAGDGIEVSDFADNTQTISAKVSTAEGNLITVDGNGLYAAMFYDGDDVE